MTDEQTGWTKVASASDTYEAELMTGRLDAAGIVAQTRKGAGAPGAWLTGTQNPFGPIDIYVQEEDVAAARASLESPSEEDVAAPTQRRWIYLVATVLVLVSIAAGVAAAVNTGP